MAAVLLPEGRQQFFTTPGVPAVGYKLMTWAAGTSTPQATYTDALKIGTNPNPIILDGRGEAVIFWDGAYKIQLLDATGAPVWAPVDNVQSNPAPSGSLIPTVDNSFTLGSAAFSWANLYLGAADAAAYDPITGNIGYIARTDAERNANVTPVSFTYAPGNLLRYGTNTAPGTTDMTAALQNASAVAAQGGGSVYVPAGRYRVAGTIGTTITVPVRIYGDGAGVTIITQTVDAHLFSYTIGNNSRFVLEHIQLVAAMSGGIAMTVGAAVNVVGASGGAIAPYNPLLMRDVYIQGSTITDEFKYGVFGTSVSTVFLENVFVKGISTTSSSSVGFNIAATSSPCGDLQFIACQTFNTNIGFNFANSTSPGIEGITMWGCQATGCNFGLQAINTLGINVYAPPQIELHGCQMECNRSPVTISNFVDVTVKGGLFYSFSNTVGDAFFNCTSVQNVLISATTAILGTADIPVLRLNGPTAGTACGNGELDGFFQGKAGSTVGVVQAVGYITNIKVRGVMNGYVNWIPSALSPTYFQSTSASLASASQTVATPGVFTTAVQAFVAGQPVVLTGAAPGGFSLNQVYYVIAAGLTTTACQLAAVPGGVGLQCTASAACTVVPISSLGGLICKPHDISPVDADHTFLTLNPSGGAAGGGTLNFQNIQSPRVNINATAGNITGATPFEPGQRMVMIFPSTGATLVNSASFQMPSLANYTIANTNAALTIDNTGSSNWIRTALAI